MDSVSAALEEILRDDLNVDVSRVTRESRLVDDVGLDSVAFAVGMVAIEDKLGVVINEQELLTCDTVGDLERVIREKVAVVS
jgi:acyl carrier protein